MVKFCLTRIEKGLITVEEVPTLWRAAVEAGMKTEQ